MKSLVINILNSKDICYTKILVIEFLEMEGNLEVIYSGFRLRIPELFSLPTDTLERFHLEAKRIKPFYPDN